MMLNPLTFYQRVRPFSLNDIEDIEVLSKSCYFSVRDIIILLEQQVAAKVEEKRVIDSAKDRSIVASAPGGPGWEPPLTLEAFMHKMSLTAITQSLSAARLFARLASRVFGPSDVFYALPHLRLAKTLLLAAGGSVEGEGVGIRLNHSLVAQASQSFDQAWRYLRNSPEIVVGELKIALLFLRAEVFQATGKVHVESYLRWMYDANINPDNNHAVAPSVPNVSKNSGLDLLHQAKAALILCMQHCDGFFGTVIDFGSAQRDITVGGPDASVFQGTLSTPRGHPFAWLVAERLLVVNRMINAVKYLLKSGAPLNQDVDLTKLLPDIPLEELRGVDNQLETTLTSRVNTLSPVLPLPQNHDIRRRLFGSSRPLSISLLYYVGEREFYSIGGVKYSASNPDHQAAIEKCNVVYDLTFLQSVENLLDPYELAKKGLRVC